MGVCAVCRGVEVLALWSNVTTMQHDSRIISENNFVNFLEQFNHSQSRRAHQQQLEKSITKKKKKKTRSNTIIHVLATKATNSRRQQLLTQSPYSHHIKSIGHAVSMQRLFIFPPLPRQRCPAPFDCGDVVVDEDDDFTVLRCCPTNPANEPFAILRQCSSTALGVA